MDFIHYLITGSFDSSNLSHLDSIVRDRSINFTVAASIFLLVLVVIAALIKKQGEALKVTLFVLMIGTISLTTLYLAGATIYKNQRSITGGPVHWHADFEIWNCGQKVNLKDPTGWSNKIGTPVFHEHNDDRIHVEGVVLHQPDVNLGNFFNVIGGKLDSQTMTAPLNEGDLTVNNGEMCNGQPAMVQAFVYKSEGSNFSQQRITNPEDYLLSGESGIPPGDCIIIEFDAPKDKTDKLCQSYKVQEQLGKIHLN